MSSENERADLPLVVGIGTEARRDDGCGLAVVRALRAPLAGRADLLELSGDPIDLLDRWAGRSLVVAVDAVRSGRPAGAVVRQEVADRTLLVGEGTTSTHGLSLAEALALGRSLGRMPDRLVVYGIEAADLGSGVGFSPAVATAVDDVVVRIEAEIPRPDPRTGASHA